MPNDWRNWVFYICIPAGCAIASAVYLWKSSARGHPMKIPSPSLQYSVGAVIALVVLSALLIGNYVIFKRFSPFPHWAYSLSFSLVPIVSGCAAWSLFARTWLYTPTVLTTLIPIALYSILFLVGELAHIALFYYSGGR